VLVSLAALAVCLAVPTGLVHDDYLRTVLWGGAILASAVGWGALFARLLYGNDARVGWGLEAALGMAVHLALGGLLVMFSLVSVKTCYVAVTLGVALFAHEAWRRAAAEAAPPGSDSRKGRGPHSLSIAGGVVVLFLGVALLRYLWMATEQSANIIDDFQAYFVFPKQLLATGTLIEPFSERRIFAYGGQSYLQALVLAFSTVFRIGVFDNGICVLVLVGLVVGWVRERPRIPVAVAIPALLGLFTLHYYDVANENAASGFSGAVFFLAMFRVLDRPRRADQSAWSNALALALVAFAACTLRQSNLPAAALIPAAYYVLRMVREGDARRRWAQEAALAALFSLALLLPWMVLAYRSCGTALYPLVVGNGSQSLLSSGPPTPISAVEKARYFSAVENARYFPISAVENAGYFAISAVENAGYFAISALENARYFAISAVEKARYFVMASLYPGRLPGLLLAFTAGLLVPSRASLALRALLAGTVLTIIMLFNALASADAIDGTDRYLFPYGLAYFLAVSLVVAGAIAYPTMNPARSVIAIALVIGALVLPQVQRSDNLIKFYFGVENGSEAALADPARSRLDSGDAPYAALQRAVPEHATVLVMLDQPFRLDFKRNRILLWDAIGRVSPPPHLPIGQGPDALARYLLGQGVRYVAYCDGPDPNSMSDGDVQTLYRLGQGVRYVAYCDRGPSPGYAPIRRQVVADLEKLTATRKQLYADNGTYVLDLATPAPASP
jgi:hypothetical protein